MNKIFLILVFISSSYAFVSEDKERYEVLGPGLSECGEVVEAAEKGLVSPRYLVFVAYAQGVITTLNATSSYIYDEQLNFAPKFPTLSRVIKNYCNENLLDVFHESVVTLWVENAK